MTRRFEVNLSADGTGSVRLDGRDIEVTGFDLTARAGHIPTLTLHTDAIELNVALDAEFDVVKPFRTLYESLADTDLHELDPLRIVEQLGALLGEDPAGGAR